MIDSKYIGALIHNLRTASDFTLAMMAERTGLSKGLLSRIENGRVSPPIATLVKIADALDVHISTFFREDGVAAVSHVPAAQRAYIDASPTGGRYHYAALVAEGYGRKLMNPFTVRVRKRGFKPISNTIPGDQFVYVTEGTLDYKYAGTVYTLRPGDALYFRGEVPHGPVAVHSEQAEYVMVLTRRFTHAEITTHDMPPPAPRQR